MMSKGNHADREKCIATHTNYRIAGNFDGRKF